MVTAHTCEWCEYASIFAELVGFVGAAFLAFPFLRSQRPRDEAAAIEPGRATDPEDAAEFKAAKAEITRDILNNVFREYRAAWVGAVLIAIAFGGKLISAIPNFL